jgi:hypothetical protein
MDKRARKIKYAARHIIAHDPEKWMPVFGPDHAQTESHTAE